MPSGSASLIEGPEMENSTVWLLYQTSGAVIFAARCDPQAMAVKVTPGQLGAGTITVLVLAWTFTILRFIARRLRRVGLGTDDYLLIASLVS